MGFKKAFNMAEVGSQFDFFRQQFNKTFKAGYLRDLHAATKGTMDAMSMMQVALQNHARGLSDMENKKIFTLSVGAAKLLGTSTADAAKRMSKAIHGLSVTGMQQFFVALNTNNQFKNMDLLIKRLTKGLNAAGRQTALFRSTALKELGKALAEVSAQTGDTRTFFMQWQESVKSMRQVLGAFLAKALLPLASVVSKMTWDTFFKFDQVLGSTSKKFKMLRNGFVDFIQMGAGVLGMGAAITGGLSMMALAASTLGVSFGTITGFLTMFLVGLKAVKGENRSWLQFLADVGTELKFYYQAFTTYRDGISTFSADVVDRVAHMSDSAQNRIMFISKALVLARVAMNGFVDGIKKGVDFIAVFAEKLGVWDSKTKQFTKTAETWAKRIGQVAGVLALVMGVKAGAGMMRGLLGKIPVVGKFFGGSGRTPKGTANDPIYTKNAGLFSGWGGVGAAASTIGGALTKKISFGGMFKSVMYALGNTKIGYAIFGKIVNLGARLAPILGGLAKVIGAIVGSVPAMLAAAGALGVVIGRVLDVKFGLSDAASDRWAGIDRSKERMFRGQSGDFGKIDKTFHGVSREKGVMDRRGELAKQLESLQQHGGGTISQEALNEIIKNREVENSEVTELIRGIKMFLETNEYNKFVVNPVQKQG